MTGALAACAVCGHQIRRSDGRWLHVWWYRGEDVVPHDPSPAGAPLTPPA